MASLKTLFNNYFSLPTYEGEEKVDQIKNKIALQVSTMLLINGFVFTLVGILDHSFSSIVESLSSITVMLVVVGLIKKGFFVSGKILLLAFAFFISLAPLLAEGKGPADSAILLFPTGVLIAGLLLDNWQFWIYGASAPIALIVLGYFHHRSNPTAADDYHSYGLFLILFALFVWLTTRYLYNSLKKTQVLGETYENIFDASGEGITIFDCRTYDFLMANRSAAYMFHITDGDRPNMHLSKLCYEEEPYTIKDARHWLYLAHKEGPQVIRWKGRRLDGDTLWIDCTLKKADILGQESIICNMKDVTRSIEIEQERRQMEKLTALGQLASGIAHDFNNQLAGITGSADLLLGTGMYEEQVEYVETIHQSVFRASDLTSKLLKFGRKKAEITREVNLNQLLRETVEILERSIDRKTEITLSLPEEEISLAGDPDQLQNALLNLGINANDAIESNGLIQYELRTCSHLPHQILRKPDHASQYALLSVTDNGSGIPESIRERIFDPFFTTKSEGKGTGLGLASTYGAIQQHGGSVNLQSKLGEGTLFLLALPLR
ncbi:MAG: ATP-binding protein [Spirochaetales bacterium]|nr:ATP-binding protein [Spirochaetales bacterium]